MSSITSITQNPLAVNSEAKKTQSKNDGDSFGKQIGKILNDVNNLQLDSGKISEQFANGEIQDVHEVMIAGEKATVGLELVMEVRNKLIEAYQEIMRMQM